jgi:hypothetical protein
MAVSGGSERLIFVPRAAHSHDSLLLFSRIEEVYGEVTGLTVRSRNIGAQLGAGLSPLSAVN